MKTLTLKNTLMINATLTLPFAMLLIFFADKAANFLGGIDAWLIQLLGVFLVLFSITAWCSAKGEKIIMAKVITTLDISWVLASIVLIILNPLNMTILATILVTAISLFVLFCAVFQLKGILQSNVIV